MNKVEYRQIPLESNWSAPESTSVGGHGRNWIADLCLFMTAVMWGINIPVVKYAVGQVDAFAFNAARLVFATFILGIFATIEGRMNLGIKGSYSKVRWGIFAFMNGFLYMVLFMFGVKWTTAGNVALLLSSMPVWTAVFSFMFLHERLKRITWVGLAITITGTFTVILLGKDEVNLGTSYLIGNLMMLIAAMTWASGTVISRKLLETVGPLTLAFWSSLITTPIHIVIAYFVVGPQFDQVWPQLTQPNIVLAILYSGLGSTGIAYALWHVGVRQLGGSHAAVYQNLVTLVAVLGGWIFLPESPLVSQIAGGLLIVAGVFVMRRGRN